MKIKSITIKGWRSFNNDEGIELNNLKRFNLIIGPNNAGKSNVMKLMEWLAIVIDNTISITMSPSELEKINLGGKVEVALKTTDFWEFAKERQCLNISIEVEITQKFIERGDEVIMIELDHETTSILFDITPWIRQNEKDPPSWKLRARTENCRPGLPYDKDVFFQNKEEILAGRTGYSKGGVSKLSAPAGIIIGLHSSMKLVDPIRHAKRAGKQSSYSFDGSDIVRKCVDISKRIDDLMPWQTLCSTVASWMATILAESKFVMEESNGDLRFKIDRGDGEKYQFLENLGSGISQILMMLLHLYLSKDEHLNVFLDEPENSLHAGALVELFKILQTDDFKNHQFFVCTHSTALMDMVSNDWTVTKVSFDPKKGSKFEYCNTQLDKLPLLDELGIRASQILQTNLVIWVEGPSDAIYIECWISALENPTGQRLINGKHYSFLFYGGSNLKSLQLGELTDEDKENLIDTFNTSRYSIIVTDSDKTRKNNPSKVLVQLLKEHLSINPGWNSYAKLWETDGREIENYVPDELWKRAMEEGSRLRKKSLRFEGKEPTLGVNVNDSFSLGRFEDFAESLISFYDIPGDLNLRVAKQRLKDHHDSNKVKFARFFAEYWTHDMIRGSLDLAARINETIGFIKKANGLV